MEFFTLNKTTYTDGAGFAGYDTAVWIERYNRPSEFTFTADPDPDLMATLAPETFISHTDTGMVMMVESHMIDKNEDGVNKLEIKGRDVATIAMENRVVTYNPSPDLTLWDWTGTLAEIFLPYKYNFTTATRRAHASAIITDYLITPHMNSAEAYPNLRVLTTGTWPSETSYERTVEKLNTVAEAVYKLLQSADGGLKIERPNASHATLDFIIHPGTDLTTTVIFDWYSKEVEQARYIWAVQNRKNAAYIATDNYLQVIRPGSTTGWNLRVMPVDATDWKVAAGEMSVTSSAKLDEIRSNLRARGQDAINKSLDISILDATISKTSSYKYGVDYNIGDKVFVVGEYGVSDIMRVVEYATTIDKTGESGFPTLAAVA